MLLLLVGSDSSLRYAWRVKLPLCAQHGISEVWIIDVVRGAFHAFDSPEQDGYAHRSMSAASGTRALKAFPELELDLSGLLENA